MKATTQALRNGLDDREDRAQHNHDVDAPELGDAVEDVGRERRGVRVSPPRDALVDPEEVRIRAHQVREHSEEDTAGNRQHEGKRQREPRCHLRVESRSKRRPQTRMSVSRFADLACRAAGRVGRARKPPREQTDHETGGQGEGEEE
jgi:hypothetical protein